MALSRSALRLLSSRAAFMPVRGYADMSLTFAAPSQVDDFLWIVKRFAKCCLCFAQVLYNGANVKQVDVPSFSGSFGILPAHVPTLAVLKPGVVTVYEQDGSAKKIFVSSGTVTVNEDSSGNWPQWSASLGLIPYDSLFVIAVQLLAEEAVPVEQLDISAAKELLAQAQNELASAGNDKDKAKAAIAIEVTEALVKACE